MFSSKSDEWETPKELFGKLDKQFHFTLDPCSTDENYKCKNHYTIADDGLSKDWSGETVFVNPPYSNGAQNKWVKKCYEESLKSNTIVVGLLPARTDTIRFHNYIYHKADIIFIKGRIKFIGADNGAPFPSMIVVWR